MPSTLLRFRISVDIRLIVDVFFQAVVKEIEALQKGPGRTVETVDLCYLSALVVAAKQCNFVRIPGQ